MNLNERIKKYIPTTKIKISNGDLVEMRQFSMLEYRGFLMAKHGDDVKPEEEILKMLDACVISDHDVYNMPYFDVERLFLELYCISASKTTLELNYRCGSIERDSEGNYKLDENEQEMIVPDSGCGKHTPFRVNIKQLASNNYKELCYQKGDCVLKFRYPTFIETITQNSQEEVFSSCLVSIIIDGEEIFISEMTTDEQDMVLQIIDIELMKTVIVDLFSNKNKIVLPMKCIHCGRIKNIELEAYDVFID